MSMVQRPSLVVRRLGAVVLLGLLVACSGQGGDDATATTAPPADEGATTEADEPGTDDTGADDDAGGCREVVHATGTACVPRDPQRIAVLDSLMALPTLAELGAPVVAATAVYPSGDPFPDFVDPEAVADVAIAGDLQTPNVEVVIDADPDLIIVPTLIADDIGDQLADIAPVVVTRYAFYEPTWRDDVRLVAEAVGREDQMDDALADLDDRIAEVGAAIEADWGEPTLTRIDVFQGAPLYYRSGCTWFGDLLGSVGVRQPEAQGPDDCEPGNYETTLVYPSLEELDVLDADVLVAYQQQAAADEVGADPLATLEASPVWTALPAVEDDRVFLLGDAWGLGVSVSAANLILDDLESAIFPAGGPS